MRELVNPKLTVGDLRLRLKELIKQQSEFSANALYLIAPSYTPELAEDEQFVAPANPETETLPLSRF